MPGGLSCRSAWCFPSAVKAAQLVSWRLCIRSVNPNILCDHACRSWNVSCNVSCIVLGLHRPRRLSQWRTALVSRNGVVQVTLTLVGAGIIHAPLPGVSGWWGCVGLGVPCKLQLPSEHFMRAYALAWNEPWHACTHARARRLEPSSLAWCLQIPPLRTFSACCMTPLSTLTQPSPVEAVCSCTAARWVQYGQG